MAILKLGVLGAGVIGLTTGLELQSQFPNAEVTILADKFNHETTSDGAAGIFRPGTSFSASSDEITEKIIHDSYRYYDELKRNYDPFVTGVSEVSGFIFSSTSPSLVENSLIDKIVPLYRKATEEELKSCPGVWKYGSYFTTVLTECRRFLPRALQDFQKKKGKVIQRKITRWDDVVNDNFDIIINCMGFGAKEICKDRKLVPIRGQVIKVSAPWIKNFYYADYDAYIIPGLDAITLGGCRNYDSYDTEISRYDTNAIWERCTNLVPSLKQSRIIRQWVGLRPHRDPVRIEPERIAIPGRTLKVVHNYGHGGYGVTTAPGSAIEAVKLVKQIHTSSSKL